MPITGDGRVLAVQVVVGADGDDDAVLLQHRAVRDLVPSDAVDAPVIMARLRISDADMSSLLREIAQASDWRCRPAARSRRPPRSVICRRILSRAPMRPGRPIIRRCSPIDIIFGACAPFAMQPVEGVDHISGEIGGAAEPVGMEELHVVGVERVGQHQVPLVSDLHEIRQVVVVGVAVVEEAAFLDQQASGVDRAGPTVCASRPAATGYRFYRRHGARDAVAFLGLVHDRRAPPSASHAPRPRGRGAPRPAPVAAAARRRGRWSSPSPTRRCWPSTSMIRHQPAREPYSKWLSIAGSGRPARRCSIFVHRLILGSRRRLIENSAPSSKLTTKDTATRAPPGQCGSGGEPAYPSRSRVLVPAWRDLRHSIFLNRRPMDYRLPVAENYTDGA